MVLLLSIALLIWRGAKRGLVIGLWVVGHVAMTAGIAEQARCYTFATAA